MTEIEVRVSEKAKMAAAEGIIEGACANAQLTCVMKGQTRTHPGAVHWHFKKGKEPGTLEISWWPRERRCWFTMQDGRKGDWSDAMAAKLKPQIEKAMAKG